MTWLCSARSRKEEEPRELEAARESEKTKQEREKLGHEWGDKLEQAVVVVGVVRHDYDSNTGADYKTTWYPWKDSGELDDKWIRLEELRVNTKEYIERKANQNVLVCGASGQGKSVLARHLLASFDSPRTVISFKPNDEYLRVGLPVAEAPRALPNPFLFQDPDAFLTAFAITFPLDVIGVVASLVPALIFSLAIGCRDWSEFQGNLEKRIGHTRDKIQLTALHFIEQHVRLLVYQSQMDADSLLSTIIEGKGSVVFDFSKLNESAKIFYAELLLRQLWKRLEDGSSEKRQIVCVDEAYRLTRGTFQRYRSVLHDVARDIRRVGALWTSTQNYTDLPDEIRNQFETQFVFKTTQEGDLAALKAIDPMIFWVAPVLPRYYFFDAKVVDRYEVKVMHYVAKVAVHEHNQTKLVPQPDEPMLYVNDGDRTVDALIVTRMIRESLRTQVLYASQLARLLMARYKLEENEAKLLINDALRPLVEGGEVRRMEFEREDGQCLVLYYKLPEDTAGASLLHNFLISHLRHYLEERGTRIIQIAEIGDYAADIETGDALYEIETGLKKGNVRGLRERVLKAEKAVFVVVPNSAIAERYSGLGTSKAKVVTMANLKEIFAASNGNLSPSSQGSLALGEGKVS